MRALKEGNIRFAGDRSVPQPVGPGIRRTLARGQSPFAIIVTCADSRVPPEHLFNTGLGELIVVRTAGHVLGAEAIATIEDAVERLNVQLCVVLGHEQCDVIAAAITQSSQPGHESDLSPSIIKLLERIEPAVRKARSLDVGSMNLQGKCEEEHAHLTVAESISRSPLLQRYASVGKFRMVAARYQTGGDVEFLPNRPLPKKSNSHRRVLAGTVPPGLPPHVALRMLRAGHRRFLGDSRPLPNLTKERRAQLTAGQQPLAIVLTDSDSRVSPEHIFDAGIGELFVIRVAGNTMTDETLASIEFAASKLGASLLVVMGHSRCESLAAAAKNPEQQQLTPHQRQLLRRLEPSVIAARNHHSTDVLGEATERNVRRTVAEARSRSALLRTLEAEGKFSALGTTYDVATGDLAWLKMAAAAMQQTAKSDGHGDAHGETHEAPHEDAHADPHTDSQAHGDGGHGSDAHGIDAHAANGHAADNHGTHDNLPTMDMAAPGGETKAGHGESHDDAHGDSHGHTHGAHDDSHGASQDTERGNPSGHDDAHGSHEEHGHADDGHGNGHGEEHGHGDGHESDGMMSYFKSPIVMIGMSGIASLLAAGILVLRRKKA
ncbi:MAG: carbonic anhydrase [Planctomycetota bacterium]|jgi:carbonic anhydrase